MKDRNYWKKVAKANATTINGILWFGFLSSITIIGLSFGEDEYVTIVGVKIPLRFSWLPLGLFTILHLIYTIRFEISTRKFWNFTELKEYSELFKDITSEGGYFMREMQPRVLPLTGGPAPMGNDLSTWLSHIAIILFYIALWRTIKFNLNLDGIYWIEVLIPIFLTYANWIIGSRWAIVLSELAIDKQYSTVLARKRRGSNQIPTIFDEETPEGSNK